MTEKMIKYCPECRTVNSHNAKYCIICGFEFECAVVDFLKDIINNPKPKE